MGGGALPGVNFTYFTMGDVPYFLMYFTCFIVLEVVSSLKVHNVFPKVTFPPWIHPVKIWLHTGSGLCGRDKPFKTNQLTTYETGDSPAATPSHWGQASSRKQSECGRDGFSNSLKLQTTFLYSIYHQRAGKTNLFHIRGVDFTLGIRYVPLSNSYVVHIRVLPLPVLTR